MRVRPHPGHVRAVALAACAVLSLLACAQRAREAPASVVVVFDHSLEQVSSPFDTSFEGMSELTRLLREHGASVVPNWSELERVLPRMGGAGHVLVLGVPWGRRYSSAALAAIDRYLHAGGGVLVLTEHDDLYGQASVQNALTERYGIRTLPARAESVERGPKSADGRWARVRFTGGEGPSGARLYWPAPLAVSEPARALLELDTPANDERRVVGAVREVGRGKLIVLADLEVLWNMGASAGMQLADNRALARHLFGMLAQRELSPRPRPPSAAAAKQARCAQISSDGGALHPGNAGAALASFIAQLAEAGYEVVVSDVVTACELAVVIAPLAPLARAGDVLRAERLILVSDGGTDLLRSEPALASSLPLRGLEAREPPINALARPLGASFARLTLIDADDAMRVAGSAGSRAVPLRRSAVLEPSAPLRAIVCANPAARAVDNLTPLHSTRQGETPSLTTRPARARGAPVVPLQGCGGAPAVVAESERAFFVADLELVLDDLEGGHEPAALEALRAWLRR